MDINEDKLQEKIFKIEEKKQLAKLKSEIKRRAGQAGKEKNKLKRTVSLRIRVSPDEYEKITNLYLESGESTLSLFARKKLLSELKIEKKQSKLSKDIQELLVIQMLKIGNNLNQTTKRVNNFNINASELKTILEELKKSLEKISEKLN